jgi:hypothetical protein
VSAGDLLLEGSGTNLIEHSEDFTHNSYATDNSSITSNATTAPDGNQTADKWIPNTTTSIHRIQNPIGTSLVEYTASVYVKAAELTTISIRIGRASRNVEGAKFDLSTGTVIENGSSITSSSITPVGNGWYRCVVTNTCTIAGQQYFVISEDEISIYAGDGTSGFFIWGAQVEANSYATSYIPTSGSTATRAADVSTSAATFGNSWYEQSEGTVFAGFELLQGGFEGGSIDNPGVFVFIDSSGTGYRGLGGRLDLNSSASIRFASRIGSNIQEVTFYSEYLQLSQPYFAAYAYADNLLAGSANGNSVYSITDSNYSSLPAPDTLLIGDQVIGGQRPTVINGTISRLTYWPTRLSNDTLQTITV